MQTIDRSVRSVIIVRIQFKKCMKIHDNIYYARIVRSQSNFSNLYDFSGGIQAIFLVFS